jgi:outer membrane protein assembly factor BamE
MHKPFLIGLLGLIVAGSGCTSMKKVTDSVAKPASGWSIVHKQTIQQGNALSQKQLDMVQIGMSKEEVRQELGTPSLVDVFHQERWEYVYWLKVPGEEPVLKTLTLHFVDGYLDRMTGDYEPEQEINEEERRIVVDVPDHEGKGLFSRALNKVGIDSDK